MQNIVPCLYLCIAFEFGYQVSEALLNETKIQKKIAEGIGIGYMAAGWVTYLCCYILKMYCKIQHPKPYANIFTMTLLVFLCVYLKLYNKEKNIKNKNTGISEILAFTVLFLFILWTMFYVFHTKSGIISSGVTVYSDFSPHTAMIRSFSYHDNFPTQYPHYGGEDVKYHFMFQFMAGNLEYLGLPIDWAFNLISAAALWGFLVLLYEFAKEITGCNAGGWLTILLFFCRSSFAGIEKILTTIISGEWDGFLTNTSFIGYTAHEDWGLWNYNVFLNQRHLGFGLLIGMIAITYFYDRLDWLDISKKECLCRVKTSDGNTPWFNICKKECLCKELFLKKDAWVLSDKWKTSMLLGILIGALAFWNGAVVVAVLLILFGFAIFSKHKLDYAITAFIAVVLSVLQTRFFMDTASEITVSVQPGFLADTVSIGGVLYYLLRLSGIFFIGTIIFLLKEKLSNKAYILACMIPVVFAFTVSMTPDIAVNHKYIIISTILLNIVWAKAIIELWNWKNGIIITRAAACILVFFLTVTGAYDLLTIYNADEQTVDVNTESKTTKWLRKNLTENDMILTGEDTMSEVTMAGVILYNGWPYYAWSAGYDTDSRAANAITVYTLQDKKEIEKIINQEGISYIYFEDGMEYEGYECSDETIKEMYECVFEDGDVKIYKTEM